MRFLSNSERSWEINKARKITKKNIYSYLMLAEFHNKSHPSTQTDM